MQAHNGNLSPTNDTIVFQFAVRVQEAEGQEAWLTLLLIRARAASMVSLAVSPTEPAPPATA
jgi:hypothetical protein